MPGRIVKNRQRLCKFIIGVTTCLVNAAAQEIPPIESPSPQPISQPVLVNREVLLKVRAKGNGRPLKRAEIKFGDQISYTDNNGQFRVNIQTDQIPEIKIGRFGYETMTLKVIDLMKLDELEIFLLPAPPSENEVLVQGVKRPEVSRKTITASEAARVSASGDPAKVTKLLPGVQTSQFGNRVVIRGSGPNDSGYFIDDVEIPEIFHRVGNISILPEKLMSEVEFSSGGFGAQRGDKHGGIITLRTTSDIPEYATTEFKINLPLYSGILHERPLSEKSSLTVSARRSYIESFVPLFTKDSQGLTLVPIFGDAHIRYLEKTETGHNKLTTIGSYDGLKLLAPIDATTSEDGRGRFSTESRFGIFAWENSRSLGDGWTLSTTPNILYSTDDTQILDNYFRANRVFSNLYIEARKRRSKDESWYIGTSYRYDVAKLDIQAPLPASNDPFFDFEEAPKAIYKRTFIASEAALWTSYDQKIANTVTTAGLRVFNNSQTSKADADPRLSIRAALNDEHLLKGAVGQFSQSPERSEASPEFGNANLNFEKSFHYILGYEWKPSDRFESDIQVFYKQTKELIVSDSKTRYDNDGERRSRGFELFLRRNPTERLFGWISYTYSKTEQRENPDEKFGPGPNDQTHVANFAGDYKFTAKWSLGGALTYRTGDTQTPVQEAVFNANLDKYQPRYALGTKYTDRLPNFHQLDLYSTYDFLYDLWKLNFRFGFQGLAITKQVFSVQYNYDYSKKEYFESLPPIPFIELKGVF